MVEPNWKKQWGTNPDERKIEIATQWAEARIANSSHMQLMIRSLSAMIDCDETTRERIVGMLEALATFAMLEGIEASENGELPDLDTKGN